MTEQHPLTDDIMYDIHGKKPGWSNPFDEEDMRAAADWQLEQVIDWIETYLDAGDVISESLKKVMRPQENNRLTNP